MRCGGRGVSTAREFQDLPPNCLRKLNRHGVANLSRDAGVCAVELPLSTSVYERQPIPHELVYGDRTHPHDSQQQPDKIEPIRLPT